MPARSQSPTTLTLSVSAAGMTVSRSGDAGPARPARISEARSGDSAAFVVGHVGQQHDRSAAQALLDLVESHGAAVAADLISGQFAAVVVRPSDVLLMTDHAGSVPLYYVAERGRLDVSSRLLPLSGRRGETRIDDRNSDSSRTFVPGVMRVPIGSVVTIERAAIGAGVRVETYSSLTPRIRERDLARATEAIRSVLTAAYGTRAARHAQSAQCFVISGGIDSSALLATAMTFGATPTTLSIGTEDVNEFAEAALVARHFGTRHREELFTADELVGSLPQVVAALESIEPDFVEYTSPLMLLYSRLEPHTVVHTGYGSDIMFAGNVHGSASPAEVQRHCAAELASIDGSNEFSVNLAWHWNLEAEHSYLDRDVVDTAMSLDPLLKIIGGIPKYVLRKAFEAVLPAETVWRRKIGIHEATGARSIFSRAVGGDREQTVEHKRRLLGFVAAELFLNAVPPELVDMEKAVHHAHRGP